MFESKKLVKIVECVKDSFSTTISDAKWYDFMINYSFDIA